MDAGIEVIVIGLGAVGSAVCHYLARDGARVVGIDRFAPPHDRGSSHGLSRVTRLAVGEGEAYVPLAQRSHVLWHELQEQTGRPIYRATGGLLISSDLADRVPYHGTAGFFTRTLQIARRFGIEHQQLGAADIRKRFPAMQVRADEYGYLEPAAGVLFPEQAVAAHLQAAQAHGATLRLNERVLGVEHNAAGAAVRTEHGRLSAGRVVLAAGPWTAALAGSAARPLRVHRQVLHWFRTDTPPLYDPVRCPIFIWMHGATADHSLYGFPMIDGVAGVKVATEQYQDDIDPDQVERHVSDAESAQMYGFHIAGRLRGLKPQIVRTATCLYTNTADAMFSIGAQAAAPAVTVVSACSGHGFKHSAALGEALAAWVMDRQPVVPIGSWVR